MDGGAANHWYYRSKVDAVKRIIGGGCCSRILDVGAGSGFFSKMLLLETLAKKAWCVDVGYDEDSDWVLIDKELHFRSAVNDVDADLVLLMDVLEHVDDDVFLLESYTRKVPCGSFVIITVPAFNFLWSEHDVFLGHKRRYTLEQICSVAERAGLVVERRFYFFGGVLPIAAAMRMHGRVVCKKSRQPRSQLKQHSMLLNWLLRLICRAELAIMTKNRFAGLTAFCVARTR